MASLGAPFCGPAGSCLFPRQGLRTPDCAAIWPPTRTLPNAACELTGFSEAPPVFGARSAGSSTSAVVHRSAFCSRLRVAQGISGLSTARDAMSFSPSINSEELHCKVDCRSYFDFESDSNGLDAPGILQTPGPQIRAQHRVDPSRCVLTFVRRVPSIVW